MAIATDLDRRRYFRGSVVGVSWHLRRPKDVVSLVQGAAVVPVIGGYSNSRAQGPKEGSPVSFTNVDSSVTADFVDRGAAAYRTVKDQLKQPPLATLTHVHTLVEGYTVLNRVKVDRIELNLVAHQEDGDSEPSIRTDETSISGLSIDGYPLDVQLDNKTFSRLDTRSKLAEAYEGDEQFYKANRDRFYGPDCGRGPLGWFRKRKIPESHGYIYTTLVASLKWKDKPNPRARIDGHTVWVDDYGRLFLGEMLITSVSRQVTLLRIQLGSPDGGEAIAGDGSSSGHEMP